MTTIASDRSPELSHPDAVRAEPGPPGRGGPAGWGRVGPERVAYVALLAATAAFYLWDLSASGWGNSFYAAAAQAGSESWKAFFFGASDAAGSITVDKPPLGVWPMALAVRVFGLSSWSVLAPQALMGVASVAVVHAITRRVTGSAWAGLGAGVVLALTPIAALMFRFDNPDSLLVLLMTGSAYAVLRALDSPRAVRWLALAGALIGLAFLTKTLQAFLVLPGFALTYAVFAAAPWRRRLGHLLVSLVALVVAGGWWVAVVELWPASSRPFIGGSRDNDFLELTFGYNGFGRLTGDETGSVGGGGAGGTGMWGTPGPWRMLGAENGAQIAWLLPAALLLGVAALFLGGRLVRAASLLLLGWLLVTGLTFSLMAGIYHAYYTVALAPAVAALVAIGAWALWQRRDSLVATAVLGGTVALTSAFAFALLDRTPDYHPWLRYAVAVVGFASALMLVGQRHLPRPVAAVVAAAAMVAVLAGPAAYAVSTVAAPHTGAIPSAGPARAGGFTMPTGGTVGGLLEGSTSSTAVTDLLLADADGYEWVAATIGANSAAGYQLATQRSVMPIGGFNGSDPSPTLAQFEQEVAAGRIHYFIAGGGGPGGGTSSGTASAIQSWVQSTFTAQSVDGVTLYDLTAPAG